MALFADGVTVHPIPPRQGIVLVSRVMAVCGRPLVDGIGSLLAKVGPTPGTQDRAALVAAMRGNLDGLAGIAAQVIDAIAHPGAAEVVFDLLRYASVEVNGVPMRLDDDGRIAVALAGDPFRAYAIAAEVALAQGLFSRRATSLVEQLAAGAGRS